MSKPYKILKSDVFPKPYDKEGLKIKLEEKRAAKYVQKGDIEPLDKPKPKQVKKSPKKDTEKKM